jgi:hypothetical protein
MGSAISGVIFADTEYVSTIEIYGLSFLIDALI